MGTDKEKLKKFHVHTNWAGYSRGESIWEVDATSEDEARETYYEGTLVVNDTIRDDREDEIDKVIECG